MTRYQAIRISRMIQNGLTSREYHDAYGELLKSCSDIDPCPVATPQPTVTVSASGTATPPPPSTPTPLGPQWWKERQAEALREQIQIIADQNKKIEELQKQIAEDNWHNTIKAGIDKACREQANELVLTNKEIIDALRHWGLRNEGSLVSNVICVIKLCAERGKEIEELKKDRNASIIASNQILGALNQTSLRQYDGSLADNVVDVVNQCAAHEKKIEEFSRVVRDRNDEIEKLKGRIEVLDRMAKARKQFDETDRVLMEKKDKEIESLKHRIEVAQGFTQQDREIIAKRNTEIADLRKQVSTLSKQISQRDMTIAVLNKQIDQKDAVITVITGLRDTAHKTISQMSKNLSEEMRETEDLKKQLETAVKKQEGIVKAGNNLRDTMKEIRSYNKLLMGEELLSDTAIQLWEDSTK